MITPMYPAHILKISLRMIRESFQELTTAVIFFLIPTHIICWGITWIMGQSSGQSALLEDTGMATTSTVAQSLGPLNMTPVELAVFCVEWTGFLLFCGTVTLLIASRILERPASFSSVLSRLMEKFVPYVITSACTTTATFVGALVMFVPGAYMMACWFLVTPIILLEGIDYLGAMRRSYHLMKGYKMLAFMLSVFMFLTVWFINGLVFSAGGDQAVIFTKLPVQALMGIFMTSFSTTLFMATLKEKEKQNIPMLDEEDDRYED